MSGFAGFLSLHPGLAAGGAEGLASLYLWLHPRTPPFPLRSGAVPPLTGIADTVLRHLEGLGTVDSVRALQHIADALPDDESVPYRVAHARDRLLETTWRPPSPDQVRTLLDEPGRMIATSDASLQQAVLGSLRSAQRRIAGPTPAINDLWDHPSQLQQRMPKPEPELTDWILRRLRDDLPFLLVNREVVISPGWRDGEPGERVDLHVTAAFPGVGSPPLRTTIVVEAKGCWNPRLDTDIRVQLADRYMARLGSVHGIYLVFWFDCKASGSKRPCGSCARRSASELEADLRQEAAVLASSGRHVEPVILRCAISSQRAGP